MHIAYTRKKYKDTYHEQILLRESYREDGKVKTRAIANLTNKPKEQVEAIVMALKSNMRNGHPQKLKITSKKFSKRLNNIIANKYEEPIFYPGGKSIGTLSPCWV